MRLSSSSAQELTACQLPLECKLLASRALAPFHLLHPQTFSIPRPSASPGTRRNSGDPSALHQGRPQLSMRRGLLARGARPRPVRPAPSWAGWPWDLSPRQRVLPLARSCARLSAVTDAPPGSPARPRDGPQALRLRGGAPRRRQPELPQRPVRRGRGAVQPRAAGAGGARYDPGPRFSARPASPLRCFLPHGPAAAQTSLGPRPPRGLRSQRSSGSPGPPGTLPARSLLWHPARDFLSSFFACPPPPFFLMVIWFCYWFFFTC